jgi:RNA polymerase sigma factor (sigma-70 family)
MRRDLVERAVSGDHDAFAQLASAMLGRSYSIARLILRDPELAQDAVQEAFVSAWRDLSGLRDPDRFESWLTRLVVRSCYREVRRRQRFGRFEVEIGAIEPGTPDESRQLADRDQLERGFRHLDPEQRAILVLHFFQGLPLTEVADVLAIPSGTVKSRLHRSLSSIRATLDADARAAATLLEKRA